MAEIVFEAIAQLIHQLTQLLSIFLRSKTALYLFLIVTAVFFASVAYYYLGT